MALTDVKICNLALLHAGSTKFIDALTEQSDEAEVCSLSYEQARDFVLEDYPWPFATRYAALGLVEATPNDDWDFSYRYPSDCVFARRLVSSLGRRDPNPPPFRIGSDDTARLLYTNQEDAVLEYTMRVVDPILFTSKFGEAVSWYLAGLIAPGLSKNLKFANSMFQMYDIVKNRAEAHSGNEQQQTPEPDSEFIRARD